MAVVPLQAVYVTANFKETQLTDVHAGQPVTIDVDTFPGATVHGVVNSIAPASGAGVRAAAAGQRHRQLHQDRAARPGEDHDRPERSADRPAASRHVGRADDRHQRGSRDDVPWRERIRAAQPSRLAEDLDRRRRRAARRLHGGAEHPGHQRLAARYRGRHRHRRRQRRLDQHRLSDRRDHRHSDDRLPQPGVLAAPLPDRQHGAVPAVLGRCAARRAACPR